MELGLAGIALQTRAQAFKPLPRDTVDATLAGRFVSRCGLTVDGAVCVTRLKGKKKSSSSDRSRALPIIAHEGLDSWVSPFSNHFSAN